MVLPLRPATADFVECSEDEADERRGEERGRSSFLLTREVLAAMLPAMPRRARQAPGGLVYHVLNRALARLPLFEKPGDFDAFERVMVAALDEHPTRLLSYC